jgi:hypothetical protein
MQISPAVDNHASATDRSPVPVGGFLAQDKGAVLFALPERLGRVNV